MLVGATEMGVCAYRVKTAELQKIQSLDPEPSKTLDARNRGDADQGVAIAILSAAAVFLHRARRQRSTLATFLGRAESPPFHARIGRSRLFQHPTTHQAAVYRQARTCPNSSSRCRRVCARAAACCNLSLDTHAGSSAAWGRSLAGRPAASIDASSATPLLLRADLATSRSRAALPQAQHQHQQHQHQHPQAARTISTNMAVRLHHTPPEHMQHYHPPAAAAGHGYASSSSHANAPPAAWEAHHAPPPPLSSGYHAALLARGGPPSNPAPRDMHQQQQYQQQYQKHQAALQALQQGLGRGSLGAGGGGASGSGSEAEEGEEDEEGSEGEEDEETDDEDEEEEEEDQDTSVSSRRRRVSLVGVVGG